MIVTKYNLKHKIQPTYRAYDLILYETIKDKTKPAVLTAQQIAKLATNPKTADRARLQSSKVIRLSTKEATK